MLKQEYFRHYKGTVYKTLYKAHHSESHEPLVVYQDVESPEKVWARPFSMFFEQVEIDGIVQDRFTKLVDYQEVSEFTGISRTNDTLVSVKNWVKRKFSPAIK